MQEMYSGCTAVGHTGHQPTAPMLKWVVSLVDKRDLCEEWMNWAILQIGFHCLLQNNTNDNNFGKKAEVELIANFSCQSSNVYTVSVSVMR